VSTWPIAPLTASDLDFAVVDYGFTSLSANELAQLSNLESTMDYLLADCFTSLADQTTLIASMDGDLDDLDNILNELATDDFDQILADLAGIAVAGDNMLSDLGTAIG